MATLEEMRRIGEALKKQRGIGNKERYDSLTEEQREQLVPSDPENADFDVPQVPTGRSA